MLQVTSEQWLSWLNLYFWPLLRVLALISTAPILSERSVPKLSLIHISEPTRLGMISYAVFCLKKKKHKKQKKKKNTHKQDKEY